MLSNPHKPLTQTRRTARKIERTRTDGVNNIAETLHPHPPNVEQWDELLEDDVERNFLSDGLTDGF